MDRRTPEQYRLTIDRLEQELSDLKAKLNGALKCNQGLVGKLADLKEQLDYTKMERDGLQNYADKRDKEIADLKAEHERVVNEGIKDRQECDKLKQLVGIIIPLCKWIESPLYKAGYSELELEERWDAWNDTIDKLKQAIGGVK